ncbi:MAG: peptidase, partial [Solirubrobacterales bacterium]|nr:peptidase [Solirubrobacterales bacterium]
MNRVPTALAALLALGVPAVASAATPAELPSVVRTLTAPTAVKRSCTAAPDRVTRGVALSRYRAPMGGYMTATLSGPSTSDWDLVAVDHATGRRMGASQAFGSDEVVQAWTTSGQAVDLLACRRSGSAKSVRLAVRFFDVAPPKPGPAVSVIRVKGGTAAIKALEDRGLDVTESRGPGWADVLVAGTKQLAIIDALGLSRVTHVANLDAYAARSARADARYTARMGAAGSPLPSGRTTYRTYDDVQADLKKLAEDHPTLVRPVTIGTSFQGRAIQGVEIAKDVKGDDGRPTFFLMGAHHAREWPSEEIALEYAHLLANPGGDDR